jgi:hypothetical protein
MLAMKIVLIVLSAVVLAGTLVLGWKALTATDPYIVQPMATLPAPDGATVGHALEPTSRMLSIVSSTDVVVVADPSASFRHEVLWLVERPSKTGERRLMEYKYTLQQPAVADHIHPIGSQVPLKIQQVTDGWPW